MNQWSPFCIVYQIINKINPSLESNLSFFKNRNLQDCQDEHKHIDYNLLTTIYLKCLHSEHVRRSEWQTILYLGDQGHPGGHGSMEGPHPGRSTVGHYLVLIVGGSPIGQVIILLHQLHLHQLRYQV